MATLKELVLAEGNRPKILKDSADVLQAEVNKKTGVTGMLIKGGFKVIRKLENGKMIEKAVDFLLDDFVDALEPFYEDYASSADAEKQTFAAYLEARREKVANALLGVTDAKRKRAKNKVLIKIYDKLRPVALRNVEEGVPAVGQLIQKYIG